MLNKNNNKIRHIAKEKLGLFCVLFYSLPNFQVTFYPHSQRLSTSVLCILPEYTKDGLHVNHRLLQTHIFTHSYTFSC